MNHIRNTQQPATKWSIHQPSDFIPQQKHHIVEQPASEHQINNVLLRAFLVERQ
jgi:hypothetical protein